MKPFRLILIAAVLAAVAGGLWWVSRNPEPGDGRLRLNGNVDVRQVDLAFEVEGRIAAMSVEEGTRVAPGQPVAELERGYFEDALALAEARQAASQAAYDKARAGSRPEEIAKARADLAEAEASARNARRTLERQAELAETSAASRQALDDARARFEQAEARREALRQALALAVAGPRSEDLAAARAQRDADTAMVELARRRLADAVLYAPAAGTILSRVREPGAVVSAGSPVYALAVSDPVWVRAYVAEPDLGRLRPGMAARVFTDSAPDRPHAGQVGFISPVAEFTPKTVETRDLRTSLVYRLRIVVADPDGTLRQGMPVSVELLPESAAN